MLVYTVSQLLEMSVDSVPESFSGKIKKIFTPQDSSKKQGYTGNPYFMQKIILTDGAKDIECMLDGRAELGRSYEGSRIYVVAGRGDKGIKGTKRKDNVWKEKTTPQIWVYDSADVSFEGAPAGQQATQAQPPAQTQRPAATTQATTGAAQPTPAPAGTSAVGKDAARQAEMKLFNIRLGKTTAAFNRCADAAFKTIEDINARHGTKFVPSLEMVEKMAMGFMVNACWGTKPGDIADFPTRPFQYYEQPAQATQPAAPEGAPFK